jgi:hypothetical protein
MRLMANDELEAVGGGACVDIIADVVKCGLSRGKDTKSCLKSLEDASSCWGYISAGSTIYEQIKEAIERTKQIEYTNQNLDTFDPPLAGLGGSKDYIMDSNGDLTEYKEPIVPERE